MRVIPDPTDPGSPAIGPTGDLWPALWALPIVADAAMPTIQELQQGTHLGYADPASLPFGNITETKEKQ